MHEESIIHAYSVRIWRFVFSCSLMNAESGFEVGFRAWHEYNQGYIVGIGISPGIALSIGFLTVDLDTVW